MKLHAILAAIVLAAPATALADTKFRITGRSVSSRCHTPKVSICRPTYTHYRSYNYCPPVSYYSAPRAYSYYSPAPLVRFSYSSTPRYYESSRYDSDYRSIEVDVQRELRRRGYYRGALDGDIGPASRAAIPAYQADRGLAITGRIDSALLRALGV